LIIFFPDPVAASEVGPMEARSVENYTGRKLMLNVERWDVDDLEDVTCSNCREGIERDLNDLRAAFYSAFGDRTGETQLHFQVQFDDRMDGEPHKGTFPDDAYFVFVTIRDYSFDDSRSQWRLEWLNYCGKPQEPAFTVENLLVAHEIGS
jgi:hypothetical protein